MCLMDWRLGRLIRSVTTISPAIIVAPLILQPNRCRVGVTIANSGGVVGITAQLVQAWPDGVNSNGFTIDENWLHITLATHGDLPTHRWDIGFNLAGGNFTVIEYFLPEEYLTIALELLRQEYFPKPK